ncbi:LOW QUALITY PROTEIN: hypothetical protein HID58_038232, partial [Brassica napus]
RHDQISTTFTSPTTDAYKEGSVIYTQYIVDIFPSKSESSCVPSTYFPGLENLTSFVNLDAYTSIAYKTSTLLATHYIPPQNIN